MVKLLILAGLVIAATAAVILTIVALRDRHRRRVHRSRREGEYAQRRSLWRSYMQLHGSRRLPRITDQRGSRD